MTWHFSWNDAGTDINIGEMPVAPQMAKIDALKRPRPALRGHPFPARWQVKDTSEHHR
jgi:hypothetical protein